MQDRLIRDLHLRAKTDRIGCVQIAVKAREIGTGNLYPQAMSWFENIARRRKLNAVFGNCIRFEKLDPLQTRAMPRAYNSFRQMNRLTVGVDINEFRGEIRVTRGGFRV
jgi:hypothetical protein